MGKKRIDPADVIISEDVDGNPCLAVSCNGMEISNPFLSSCSRFMVHDTNAEYGIPVDFAMAMRTINHYLAKWHKVKVKAKKKGGK